MLSFTTRLADVNICITANYAESKYFCKDYLSDGVPDFSISVHQQDIDYERFSLHQKHLRDGTTPPDYSDKYLERISIYRKIADGLLDFDTLLVHGSAVAVDGKCYIFTAKSGTGKSTHTRLWREYFGDRAVMVNDDKPLLKVTDGGVVVYGTPWNGKHKLGSNISVPLQAVCKLERDSTNHIERMDKKDAWQALFQQAYRSPLDVKILRSFHILDIITSSVGLYSLGCNMDPSAAEVSYLGMKKLYS